ncbi:MAG: lipoprotein-releasing system ATP-binding protein [Methanolobus sp.]|jgi:lipoprotein-releasing system ATP-binding protein|nr:lipoprotein-releasing system ATP-binding protein [Methanolobus sp.]MDN5309308.1 lipoprotein-releasing system ATP-binding protein [Methanolobus sp.]
MNDEPIIIEIRNLSKVYPGGVEVRALDGIDLDIKRGEFLSIIGPSGSGKSTLLHMIGILDTPSSGTITIDGRVVTEMSEKERSKARNEVLGFVFQYHHLLPDFTALENVMIPLLIAGTGKKAARDIAAGLLEDVGLAERMDHLPSQL